MLLPQVKEGWEPLCRFLGVPVPQDQVRILQMGLGRGGRLALVPPPPPLATFGTVSLTLRSSPA